MNSNLLSPKNIAKIAILAALSAILMQFRTPLPFAPNFIDFDVAEVPALIGGFAMGPIPGLIIVALKIFIKFLISGTSTAFIGELSNLVVNGSLVVVAAVYYKRNRTFKGAIISMILAVLTMATVATLSNYFIMFPLYANVYGIELEGLVQMGAQVNPLVSDYKTLMLFTIVPFNLLKGIVTSLITTLLYPRISPILKK
ncbi:MAG TPA: ECF transporter S component [Erysipelothrix sp.]|jgi:riboflavin transporter FmnP|nr:ECF transporter S component [Erysipelothrix sp.]